MRREPIVLFDNGEHQCMMFDDLVSGEGVQSNQFLITDNEQYLLLDPGGDLTYTPLSLELSKHIPVQDLTYIFASHQDPDICSSLALWLEFNPAMRCHVSWLWSSFIPHFGGTADTFVSIPDEGADISLDGLSLRAVPAHYLHSSGNFNLYDKVARVMFSGDVGAALLPPGEDGLFVDNFDKHIRHAEGFHRRWMGSNEAKRRWCERVSQMEIDMLCPQHGAIYQGADVQRFINWFDELQVGIVNG